MMSEIIYRLCSFICHQHPDHTFGFQGAFLPLCFRCTGIYTGFLAGFLFQVVSRRRNGKALPPWSIIVTAVIFVLIMAIDAVLDKSINYLRFFTGLLTGSTISLFLFPVLNYLFRKSASDSSVIAGWKDYLGMLAVIVLLSGGIFINIRPVLFLFQAVSLLGLSLLFILLGATILKRASEGHKHK